MRFELAKWDVSLIPSLAENANDARIGQYLNTGFPYPYTAEAAKKYVSAVLNSPQDIHRAVLVEGEAAGCVSLCRGKGVLCRSAELGYWHDGGGGAHVRGRLCGNRRRAHPGAGVRGERGLAKGVGKVRFCARGGFPAGGV